MNSSDIYAYLDTQSLGKNCFCFSALDSTSTYIRNGWRDFPHGLLVTADEQLSGRGRSGKSFFSPQGGLYFSLLLKEKKYINDPLFTVKMSYAVCRAIDKLTASEQVKIKWVNDIYFGSRKLAGILCEAVGNGGHEGIIVGIGVNFTVDKATVPAELRNKIGSLHDLTKKKLSKEQLCARILNEIEAMYAAPLDPGDFIAAYRRRSAVLGKEINVLRDNLELRAAALDIAPDGGLIVRYQSGITEKLTAGEISIILT